MGTGLSTVIAHVEPLSVYDNVDKKEWFSREGSANVGMGTPLTRGDSSMIYRAIKKV